MSEYLRAALADSAQKLVEREFRFSPGHFHGDDALGEARASLWKNLAQAGFLSICLPEPLGGIAGGMHETGTVARELGRSALNLPFSPVALALPMLCGTIAERCGFLEGVASGSRQLAVWTKNLELPSALESAAVPLLAEPGADLILWAVGGQDGGPARILLRDLDGCPDALHFGTLIDGSSAAVLERTTEQAGELHTLLEGPDAERTWTDFLEQLSIVWCHEIAGISQSVVHATLDHTRLRKQFGREISRFQVVGHRLVDMTIALREIGALVDHLVGVAPSEYNTLAAASRKAEISAAVLAIVRNARMVGQQAIQLHGAMGLTSELFVGHGYKRIEVLSTLLGTLADHVDRICAFADADDGLRA